MTERTLLIDGDVLAYKFATVTEKPIDWGDGVWTLHANEGEAQGKLDDYIAKLMTTLKANSLKIALTPSQTFRTKLYPLYKSNRKEVRKPLLLAHLKQHMQDTYETWIRDNLEGDDVLGILATVKHSDERVIVSVDKDFKCIPGLIYNDKKPDQGVVKVTEEEADRFHMIQTLTGDTTDGYPGCPGIGPKKAADLIDATPRENWWSAVVAAFEKAKLTEEDALTQARLARILRATDYDFKKKEPILWTPSRGK